MKFPQPKDKKAIRQFLGIGSYYRRFIQNYARRAEPLQKLIAIDVDFVWGPEQQDAFQDIKNALKQATLMRHPDPTKDFIIDCDASTLGLGAALHQRDAFGKEYPVAFASRTLRPNERKWTITELEALAVVWALETFRIYIEASPTLVRTDHSPLLWLRNNAGNSLRLSRWVLRLQDFKFDLLHRPGAANRVADALSRNPIPSQEHTGDEFVPSSLVIPSEPATPPLVAFINQAERCQLCWGQARGFLTRGEEEHAVSPTNHERLEQHAQEIVQQETLLPGKESREIEEIGISTLKDCQLRCQEAIASKQYLLGVSGTELPRWVVAAGLKPKLKEGVLCLKSERDVDEESDKIFVPSTIRIPLIQRLHAGTLAGHLGYKKTLAKLRLRYIWGSMSSDVQKVIKTCIQCWRHGKGITKGMPLRSLPRGWPGEIVAMDLFGPLPKNEGRKYVRISIY